MSEPSQAFLDEFSFCPVLREMLSLRIVKSDDGEVGELAGSASTLSNLRIIAQLICELKPTETLEIGLAQGVSALVFLGMAAEGSSAEQEHVAIDPFQATAWKNVGVNNIKRAGYATRFELIEQDSALALPELCRQKRKFQLIYIDGSHLFECVFIDFFFSTRLLSLGGVIAFDDCADPNVRKVVRFIERNYGEILQRISRPQNLKTIRHSIADRLGRSQFVAFKKVKDTSREWNAEFKNF